MRNHNITPGSHYFIRTRPMDYIPLLGLFIGKSYGPGEPTFWAEFEVIEDRYKLEDNYKVELKAVDPIYGRETFYRSDFESMVESGFILKKTGEGQHVQEITWREPLCGRAYLVHEATIVVDDATGKAVQLSAQPLL